MKFALEPYKMRSLVESKVLVEYLEEQVSLVNTMVSERKGIKKLKRRVEQSELVVVSHIWKLKDVYSYEWSAEEAEEHVHGGIQRFCRVL